MQTVDEAFVLRTQPLGDADLLVSLLARAHGRVRGVARSARRSRKRFGGLLEPMTHVLVTWTTKPGRDLHRIEGLEARHSFAAMQADPTLQAVCAVLAEVSEAFGTEGDADDREFRLVGAVLAALESGAEPLSLLRYFELWTLRLHGLLDDPGHSAGGPGLSPPEAAWLQCLQRSEPGALPPSCGHARPGGRIDRLFRAQLESFSERRFRSYRHVQALAAWSSQGQP